MSIQRIGVLTSGGDAPGMNAAVRSVVRTAISRGIEVMGVYRGYHGLIRDEVAPMDLRSVADIIHRGGTMLYTARSESFRLEEGVRKGVEICTNHGIEGLVCIGGDGTFRGAQDLCRHGIPCIGIPATIDNDISCCQHTIGFDTALNTCVEMIDKLRDTAQSHDRVSLVEVMGRRSGELALGVGLAVGATAILVPEMKFDLVAIIDRIKAISATGKKHFIIVVAEGVGGTVEMAEKIQAATGAEARATILGHVQRGGSPTAFDRKMASEMGHHAVELLIAGKSNRVVASQDDMIRDYDIEQALSMRKPFPSDQYDIAKELSI